jgi:hypothetical protein
MRPEAMFPHQRQVDAAFEKKSRELPIVIASDARHRDSRAQLSKQVREFRA